MNTIITGDLQAMIVVDKNKFCSFKQVNLQGNIVGHYTTWCASIGNVVKAAPVMQVYILAVPQVEEVGQ